MSEITMNLKHPLTEEEMDIIQDSEMEHTNSITFHTKKGKEVKFIKVPAWLPIDKEKLEAGELIEDGTWCFFTNGVSVSVERYKADREDSFPSTRRSALSRSRKNCSIQQNTREETRNE